jgi:hypothetical protein
MSRTRWALATLLAACLFGACSDDDPKPDIADPTSSPPNSSTPVSTPTSSSPTTSPVTARETVDAWLHAWTVAMQTGDTGAVKELSTDTCDSCQRLIAKVDEVYGKGGHYQTQGWSAIRVSEAPDSREATPSYVMQVVQAKRTLYNANGQAVDTAPRTTQPMRMTFDRAGDRWLLARLEILE